MLHTLRNAWRIPEMRRKLFYTLIMLFIYRLGCWIPVPGVDFSALKDYMSAAVDSNPIFGLLNMISGGSFANFTLFALGISPYITTSIIMQLLTVAIPSLGRMVKEDEDGRQKLNKITRYVSIGLALVEALGFIFTLRNNDLLVNTHWMTLATIAMSVTAGCMLVVWMGERITQRGVGNGISLIIFVSIVARMPAYAQSLWLNWKDNLWVLAIIVAVFLAIIVFVVWIDMGQRRIPVQYAKQQRGRKLYGGQSTHLPIKVNSASVLPIIFAMSFLSIPQLIASYFPSSGFANFVYTFLSPSGRYAWVYILLYMLLIFAFTFFYNSISIDTKEIAKNLQQSGGFIQGIRPGKNTSDYIQRVSSRLTFFCAIFLAVLAVLPMFFSMGSGDSNLQQVFSASSILIMVSVALETSRQIESQMMVRSTRGFLS